MSAIKPRGMVHACIPVKDLEISKKFYTEMLGLEFLRLSEAYQLVFLMAGKDYLILAKSETPINPNPPGIRTAEERAILFGQTAASVQAAVR